MLDSTTTPAAVVSAQVDWASAFDRIDPTLAIFKFQKLGLRSSLIPTLISYLTDRSMQVRFKGKESSQRQLIGGGPQGTLVGVYEYIVASDDCASDIEPEDRYKYIDDLTLVEMILLSSTLVEYDFQNHVASDIGTDHLFLPPETFASQQRLDNIVSWTDKNLMLLNEKKSNYIIFTRSKSQFSTRLQMNNQNLERQSVTKILGM